MSEPVETQLINGWHKGTSVELPFSADLIAAPDRYREALTVLRLCKARIDGGASPCDNIVVARECWKYANVIPSIAEMLNLPVRIETQQQLSETLPFALVVGALELAAATEPVYIRDVLRPLRREFCLSGEGWPIPPSDLNHFINEFADEQRHPVDWVSTFESIDDTAADRVATAVRWLVELPEPDGDVLTNTVQELINHRNEQVVIPAVQNSKGPSVVDGESKFRAAGRLSQLTPKAGESFDRQLEMGVASSNWTDALDAWRTLMIERPGQMPKVNAAAIPVIDANDAQFAEKDWVFILGANEGEFPRIDDKTTSGIRVDQHADLIERELDQVAAAFGACREQLVMSYRYTATDGNPRSPSPLVDILEFDETKRISLDEPCPVVSVGSVVPTQSPHERRLLDLADAAPSDLSEKSAGNPGLFDTVSDSLTRRTQNLRTAIVDKQK